MRTSEKTLGERAPRGRDSLVSTQVNDFVIEERIGEGGMGVVYRAVHPLIGKQVAIKVLRAENVTQQQVERLLIEARSVNAIRHPGIIDIFGFGNLPDGRPYIIMELLRGQSLAALLQQNTRLDPNTTVWILDQMLSALGAAHEAGVLHRDLKPGNVFLAQGLDGTRTVKLVDFGIAKLMHNPDGPTTVDGTIMGTPEYMAPEQIRGNPVSFATDLYAVGVMAFHMLTGVRPFKGDQFQVLFAHIEQPPPLPSSRIPGIPAEFDTLILHLLAKDAALRPESAEAVRQALKRIPPTVLPATAPLTAPLPLPESRTRTTASRVPVPHGPRRAQLMAWALGGAVLASSILGGAFLWQQPRTPSAASPIPQQASPASAHLSSAHLSSANLGSLPASSISPLESPPQREVQDSAMAVTPSPHPSVEPVGFAEEDSLATKPHSEEPSASPERGVEEIRPGSTLQKPKNETSTRWRQRPKKRSQIEPTSETLAPQEDSALTLDEVLARKALPLPSSSPPPNSPPTPSPSPAPLDLIVKAATPTNNTVPLEKQKQVGFLSRSADASKNQRILALVYKLEATYLAGSVVKPEFEQELTRIHQRVLQGGTPADEKQLLRALQGLQAKLSSPVTPAPGTDARLKKYQSDTYARLSQGEQRLRESSTTSPAPPEGLEELSRLRKQVEQIPSMTGEERFNFGEQISRWEKRYLGVAQAQ